MPLGPDNAPVCDKEGKKTLQTLPQSLATAGLQIPVIVSELRSLEPEDSDAEPDEAGAEEEGEDEEGERGHRAVCACVRVCGRLTEQAWTQTHRVGH